MKLNAKTANTLKLATIFTAVAFVSGCASTMKNTYGQLEGTVNDSVSDLGCSMRGGDWYSSDQSSWGYAGGSNKSYNANVNGQGKGTCVTGKQQKAAYRVRALSYYARTAQSEILTQSQLNRTACSAFTQHAGQMQTCRGIYEAGRQAGLSVKTMTEKKDIKLKADTYVDASMTYRQCLADGQKSFGTCFVDYSNQVSTSAQTNKQKYAF